MTKKEIDATFQKGIKNQDRTILSMVPKSDVHNHAGRGGKVEDLSCKISPRITPFDSLNEMQEWFEKEVKANISPGVQGYLSRVEASFKQAQRDNIKKLALSFGVGDVYALEGIENFLRIIDSFKEKYIPDSIFFPELSLLRSNISDEEIARIKALISYGYFKSIDICGNEKASTLDQYVPLYQYAKLNNMILKLHVGEFGTSDDIVKAVNLLELDEIHHGIAAAESKECMKLLRDNKIILNICPMSNIMLKRVENYSSHPIKKLFDAGVPVTINTDDLTIFNTTISDEYINLYKHEVFTINELNFIRVNGLNAYNKYSD